MKLGIFMDRDCSKVVVTGASLVLAGVTLCVLLRSFEISGTVCSRSRYCC